VSLMFDILRTISQCSTLVLHGDTSGQWRMEFFGLTVAP